MVTMKTLFMMMLYWTNKLMKMTKCSLNGQLLRKKN